MGCSGELCNVYSRGEGDYVCEEGGYSTVVYIVAANLPA
jgi:hypothetical protein